MGNYQNSINWYDEHAKEYASQTRVHSIIDQLQMEQFTSLLPRNTKVLDAGCGGGRDTKVLNDKGYQVIGVDISDELIKQAKKQYPELNFEKGDLLNLKYRDQFFNGIWCHVALVHFENEKQISKAFSELSRVLINQGIIHILVKAGSNSSKTTVTSESNNNHDRFFYYFTKEELEKLLKKNGLDIITLQQYREADFDPKKMPWEGINWILVLARKKHIILR